MNTPAFTQPLTAAAEAWQHSEGDQDTSTAAPLHQACFYHLTSKNIHCASNNVSLPAPAAFLKRHIRPSPEGPVACCPCQFFAPLQAPVAGQGLVNAGWVAGGLLPLKAAGHKAANMHIYTISNITDSNIINRMALHQVSCNWGLLCWMPF